MRWRLFQSTRDEVDIALRDLSRQGAGRAQIAHVAASLLVILFSAGSLVALASDPLAAVLGQYQASHTIDIPSAIVLGVTFLTVICCDVALLQAASTLRVLATRRAGLGERWVHGVVMAVVSLIEAGSYLLMSFTYEHPTGLAAQSLIIARALAAPLLAVYLSSSRAVPVTPRDMLAFAELNSGAAVLRDIVAAANNREIDLPAFAARMRLYAASAVMQEQESKRLAGMIQAVVDGAGPESHYTRAQEGSQSADTGQGPLTLTPLGRLGPSESHPGHDFDKPPTGPGSPAASPVRTGQSGTENTKAPATIRLVANRQKRIAARGSNRSGVRGRHPVVNHEEIARAAWANGARSVEKMRRATGMSKSTAQSYVRTFKAENAVRAEQSAQQQTAQ